MAQAPVRITWNTDETGGSLPFGKRYAGVSRWPEDSGEWKHGGWTVVIEFEQPPTDQGNPSKGIAHFLREEAPHDRLGKPGAFELFQLKKRVAEVEVIGK